MATHPESQATESQGADAGPERAPGSFARGLVSGTAASLASTAALLLLSKLEAKTALSAQNAVSHWVWGERAKERHALSVRYTLLGYAIHHASSVFWGVIYEHYLKRAEPLPLPLELARALAFAALANFVDYRLTPQRLKPGFERHLSTKSLVIVYSAFAVGIATGHVLQRGRTTSRTGGA